MNGNGERPGPGIDTSSPDAAVRGLRRLGVVPTEVIDLIADSRPRTDLPLRSRDGNLSIVRRLGHRGGGSAGVQEAPGPDSFHEEIRYLMVYIQREYPVRLEVLSNGRT